MVILNENKKVCRNDKLVELISNNFSKHRKISNLDRAASDFKSNIAYLSNIRNLRKYHTEISKIKSQHGDIKVVLEDLLKMDDIQEHEINYIMQKNGEIEELMKQTYLMLKKVEKKKKVVYTGRIIIAITLLASTIQIGRCGYDYKNQIKEFCDENLKPTIVNTN